MTTIVKESLRTLIVAAVLILVFGLMAVVGNAFTPPTAYPPGGNAVAPINTSNTTQSKAGSLSTNNFIARYGLGVGVTANTSFINGRGIYLASPDANADFQESALAMTVAFRRGATTYNEQVLLRECTLTNGNTVYCLVLNTNN